MKRHPERRATPRELRHTPALIGDDNSLTVECTVIDFSVSGARLKFPSGTGLKNGSILHIPAEGIKRRIEVVWQSADQAGVQFQLNILPIAGEFVSEQKPIAKPIPVEQLRNIVRGQPVPRSARSLNVWRMLASVIH
jgi:hypothetical protein